MKKLSGIYFIAILFSGLFYACEKDLEQAVLVPPTAINGFSASANNIVLSSEQDDAKVVTFKFEAPEFGTSVAIQSSLLFDDPADTTGGNAWGKAVEVKLLADSTQRSFTGKELNTVISTQLGLAAGSAQKVAVRLKTTPKTAAGEPTNITPVYSSLVLTVTPYKAVTIYPALVVKGGNSWLTPPVAERANGYVLTSVGFNSKYEGYLYLPNADSWGGEAFKLVSTTDQKEYGWGASATTIAEGGGNLWLSPAPNYMRVNVDLEAKMIAYTPVQFYVTGDHNSWNTSANPMTFDPNTKLLTATNVSLTEGKKIVFTANGNYDISYKVDAEGKLIFAGKDVWGGQDIIVPKTGTFTVMLDLSQGAGNYTYSIK